MSLLKNKLSILARQVGQTQTPESGEHIKETLASLGVKRPTTKRHHNTTDLEKIFGGKMVAEGVLLIERHLKSDFKHGNQALSDLENGCFDLSELPSAHINDYCFFDLETTGLSSGSGTVIFLAGVFFINNDQQWVIQQYLLTGYRFEKQFLALFSQIFKSKAIIVSYNGKSFDSPILVSRFRMTRQAFPVQRHFHWDLLHYIRRAYSLNWPDCSLQMAEKKLLDFYRQHDMPGSEAPAAWFDWLRNGNVEKLSAIIQHHFYDLLSMPLMAIKICKVYKDPQPDVNVSAIARYFIKNDQAEIGMDILEKYRHQLDHESMYQLAVLYRRKKDWERALEIWLQLVRFNHPSSIEDLAKYHEHQKKQYQTALDYTTLLLKNEPDNACYLNRKNRLLIKLLKHA